ncbi:hypothetical protein ACROYT_G023730 [Oculina patagonica]
MVDKIHSCAPNTRCACFYDLACPGSLDDPCQPYRLPPPIPAKFTLTYESKLTDCFPSGCIDVYYSGREIQILSEHKRREDWYYPQSWLTDFVLPGNESGFSWTSVDWGNKKCYTDVIKTFPTSQAQVPPDFSFNGTVKLGDRLCEQWILKFGGHGGLGTSLISYYISNQTNEYQKRYPVVSGEDADPFIPVMVETFNNYRPMENGSDHEVLNYTSFAIGKVDEDLLELPSFC